VTARAELQGGYRVRLREIAMGLVAALACEQAVFAQEQNMVRAGRDFDSFVKNQRQVAEAEKSFDKDATISEWRHNLTNLYEKLRVYINDYIESGYIKFETHPITLSEEFLGPYQVEQATIKIGNKKIELTPVGTLLIGSKGRVDVKGSAGSGRLVLVGKNSYGGGQVEIRIVESNTSNQPHARKEIDWTWKIATSPPAVRLNDLNKESFEQLILEVSNG
jgi:hypothetical protein